jgi:hypothetical protein
MGSGRSRHRCDPLPACNSTRIQYPQLTRKFLTPALAGILLALKIFPKEFYCEDCHFTWTNEPEQPRYRFWNRFFSSPESGANSAGGCCVGATRSARDRRSVLQISSASALLFLIFQRQGKRDGKVSFDCAMKWLFALLLAVVIFGGAALFTYKIFVRPEIVMRGRAQSRLPARPTPDVGRPEFEAAKKLKRKAS